MALASTIKYEPEIKNIPDISPETVLSLLYDVISDIKKLDNSFTNLNLAGIVEIINTGRYELKREIPTHLDLSSAKKIIDTYRELSEGGCKSCIEFCRDIINDDKDTFFYCGVREHYQRTPPQCGYQVGFSPELKKHYHQPCDTWKPKFSPKLEELIKDQK